MISFLDQSFSRILCGVEIDFPVVNLTFFHQSSRRAPAAQFVCSLWTLVCGGILCPRIPWEIILIRDGDYVIWARFGPPNNCTPAIKSSIAVLSAQLFSDMSPSARTSKGFFIAGKGFRAQQACSTRTALWSRFRDELTELLTLLDETWFKSRSHLGQWHSAFQRENCCHSSRDRSRPALQSDRNFRKDRRTGKVRKILNTDF